MGGVPTTWFLFNMVSSWSLKLLVANLVIAGGLADRPSQGWRDGKFKTLVTFGDSFTDESRLGYFINNKGSAPPVAWQQPVVRHLPTPFAGFVTDASSAKKSFHTGLIAGIESENTKASS